MNAIAPWLSVTDATAAVAFYRAAFGATSGEIFEVGGAVQVAQLFVAGAPFWVQQDDDLPADIDPGRAVRMIVVVDEPTASLAQAVDAGATEMAGVHDQNGWETGRFRDPFGHQWEVARQTDPGH
jgi:PhnB protein